VNEGTHLYEDGLFHFQDYGVHVFAGPNYEQDEKTICDNFDEDICNWFKSSSGGEPVSVQTEIHWAQNCIQQRFQEYAPDYLKGKT